MALRAEGGGIALSGDEFYNAACGGHVSIEYLFSPLTSYTLSPLRGPLPLKGTQGALRDWLSVSYGMISILVIGSLRSPPYPAVPDFPLCRGQNKTPRDNLLINPPLEMTVLAGSIGHAFDVRVQRVQRVVLSPSRAMSFIGLPGRPTPSTTGVVPLPLQAGGGKFTGERSLSRLRARIYEGSSIECRRLFPYFPKREGGGLLL